MKTAKINPTETLPFQIQTAGYSRIGFADYTVVGVRIATHATVRESMTIAYRATVNMLRDSGVDATAVFRQCETAATVGTERRKRRFVDADGKIRTGNVHRIYWVILCPDTAKTVRENCPKTYF